MPFLQGLFQEYTARGMRDPVFFYEKSLSAPGDAEFCHLGSRAEDLEDKESVITEIGACLETGDGPVHERQEFRESGRAEVGLWSRIGRGLLRTASEEPEGPEEGET